MISSCEIIPSGGERIKVAPIVFRPAHLASVMSFVLFTAAAGAMESADLVETKPPEFIVVGEAEIEAENTADARERAIEAALVLLVEEGLASILPADLRVLEVEEEVPQEVSESIRAQMMRYIDKYQIIMEMPEESLYRVEVKGILDLDRMRETLASLGVLSAKEEVIASRLTLSVHPVESFDLYEEVVKALEAVPGVGSITLHKMRAGRVWFFVDFHGGPYEMALAVETIRIDGRRGELGWSETGVLELGLHRPRGDG